jgi:hypothetical protein
MPDEALSILSDYSGNLQIRPDDGHEPAHDRFAHYVLYGGNHRSVN